VYVYKIGKMVYASSFLWFIQAASLHNIQLEKKNIYIYAPHENGRGTNFVEK
jgi:hypothetical protein